MALITIPDKNTGDDLTAAEFNEILDALKDGTLEINTAGIQIAGAAIDTDDVAEGTNLYYTDERAQDAIGSLLADSSEIDVTYNDAGDTMTLSIVAGSIDETKLDTSTNASLDLADSSVQPGDNVSTLTNDSGFISNVVEDTSPQLGGDLDAQNNNLTGVGRVVNDQTGANAVTVRTDWATGSFAFVVQTEDSLGSLTNRFGIEGGQDTGDVWVDNANFGINNQNPAYPLDVSGTIGASEVAIDDGGGAAGDSYTTYNGRAAVGYDGAGTYATNADAVLAGLSGKGVTLVVDSTVEALNATTAGDIGIGTSSPGAKMDIVEGSATGGIALLVNSESTSNPAVQIDGGADGQELLKFNTDRAWIFKQQDTGATTSLQLHSESGDKAFHITNASNEILAQFNMTDGAGGSPVQALNVPTTLTDAPTALVIDQDTTGLAVDIDYDGGNDQEIWKIQPGGTSPQTVGVSRNDDVNGNAVIKLGGNFIWVDGSDNLRRSASYPGSDSNGSALLENVVEDTTPSLGGTLDAADNDIQNIKLAEFQDEHSNGNSGASATVDWGNGNGQSITLTDNATLSFTAPSGPGWVQLRVVQDATGSRTVTWPTVKWAGGSAPTLSTAANAEDVISFYYNGTSYYGVGSLDFS